MAIGDAALAAGMSILSGNELANTIDTEINRSRDYIAERTNAVTPVAKGGTGATTAATARSNLGLNLAAPNVGEPNKIPVYNGQSQLTTAAPTADDHCARKRDVDAVAAAIPPKQFLDDGSTYSVIGRNVSTDRSFFTGGATAATSGYTVAYINFDGRISKGASSERYKKFISAIDADSLGDVWPDLSRFQMRHGDGTWKYGYIAERLAEHPDQQPFVVYADVDGELVPDSIDFIALLMVQNAQLHQAVDLLTQRIQNLEGGV